MADRRRWSGRRRAAPTVIGWREWCALPELGVRSIKAKIDTGARTSALHAFALRRFVRDGAEWVGFEIHPHQRSSRDAVRVEAPVHEWRSIRSSNGQLERRPVVRTAILVDGELFPIDITLTRRDEMGFRLLLGRTALRSRFVVDPGRSFVGVVHDDQLPERAS